MLKYTLNLLSDVQRTQIIKNISTENSSHPNMVLRLGLDLAVNGEMSKLKQLGQAIVNRIKECFTKLNPRSELVTTDECTELVNGHFE